MNNGEADAPGRFLPYGRHWVDADDHDAVAAVLESDWLTTGPAVAAFESDFARVTDARHAVACANGTAALHLSALALGLGPGDWAIVPAVTFLATANAARYVGADVHFADVDPDTGLMGPNELIHALDEAKAQGRRVRAVFPVHLAGQCPDMPAIRDIAKARGLYVVEDACHALGGWQRDGDRWAAVGACRFSDLAVFSLHPVKTITMGEGGVITTNDKRLAGRLALLRSHGMLRDPDDFSEREQALASDGAANPWYYEMAELGFNYRASDIQCALGKSQLAKLARFIDSRAESMAHYRESLAPLAPLVRMAPESRFARPAWHLAPALVDFAAAKTERAAVMHRLRAKGIGTQVHYLPVNRQPYYRRRYGATTLPGADGYYARALSLPLFVGLTKAEVGRVAAGLAAALKG